MKKIIKNILVFIIVILIIFIPFFWSYIINQKYEFSSIYTKLFQNKTPNPDPDIDIKSLQSLFEKINDYNLGGAVIQILNRKNDRGDIWEISRNGNYHFLYSKNNISFMSCAPLCYNDFSVVAKADSPRWVILSPDKSFVINENPSKSEQLTYDLQYGGTPGNLFFLGAKNIPLDMISYLNNNAFSSSEKYVQRGPGRCQISLGEINYKYSLYEFLYSRQKLPQFQSKDLFLEIEDIAMNDVVCNEDIYEFSWMLNNKYILFRDYGGKRASGGKTAIEGISSIYSYEIATKEFKKISTLENPYRIIDGVSPTEFFVSKKGETYMVNVNNDGSSSLEKILPREIKLVGIIP